MDAWTLLAAFPPALLLIHAVLARLLRGRLSNQMAALAAGGAAVPLVVAADALAQRAAGAADLTRTLYIALCGGCAAYSYFHFFNMTETSRRIKLLRMTSGIGRESPPADYDLDDILTVRLGRLAGMKQIRREGDRYVLAGRALYAAYAALEQLKRLLALPDTPPPAR